MAMSMQRPAAVGGQRSCTTRSVLVPGISICRPARLPIPGHQLGGGRAALLVVHAAAPEQTEEAKFREAEQRWQSQIRDGKVRNVSSKDAGSLLKDGWVLLDVRPPDEVAKVAISGAVEVPLFVPDTSISPASLLKRASAFGLGGWWLGGGHMEPNKGFLLQVAQKVPKDAKVIVGCQKGLRSLAACEQLIRAGYSTVAWVNGGFDTYKAGDLPTVNDRDLRYAGIGGLSQLVGWTEVQQDESKSFLGGATNFLKLVGVVLLLDALFFAYEQANYLQASGGP